MRTEPGDRGADEPDHGGTEVHQVRRSAVADDAQGPDAEQQDQEGRRPDERGQEVSGAGGGHGGSSGRAGGTRPSTVGRRADGRVEKSWRSCAGSRRTAAAPILGRPLEASRRSLCGMSLLRQPILLLAKSEQVKKLVSTMPVSSGIVTSYVPGETTDDAVAATAELVEDGLRRRRSTSSARTPLDVAQADATVAAYKELLAELARRGLAAGAEVIGQAAARSARRCPTNGEQGRAGERPRDLPRRPQRRHHGHPRHGGPHHHRLDARRSCASSARTSPRPAPCSRRCCTAPRPTAGRWPTRARGSGCARAPTSSPRRSPSRSGSTSTSPTSAASRCCWPARATRWSPATTRG